jgi:hypothetical protein
VTYVSVLIDQEFCEQYKCIHLPKRSWHSAAQMIAPAIDASVWPNAAALQPQALGCSLIATYEVPT